jgi:hypothetical protein
MVFLYLAMSLAGMVILEGFVVQIPIFVPRIP